MKHDTDFNSSLNKCRKTPPISAYFLASVLRPSAHTNPIPATPTTTSLIKIEI